MPSMLWSGWIEWWSTVTPEFALLLGLPFLVAIAGLVALRLTSTRT